VFFLNTLHPLAPYWKRVCLLVVVLVEHPASPGPLLEESLPAVVVLVGRVFNKDHNKQANSLPIVGQEMHGAENNNLGMLQHSSPQGMGNFVNSFEGRLQVSLSLSVISSVFDPISSHIPVKIKEKIWKGEFIDLNL
jgi:hypothetical protein